MGLYLCLAEILVGKTGVPGEKTTARAKKGVLFPLRSGGDPLYCDPHSFGFLITVLCFKYMFDQSFSTCYMGLYFCLAEILVGKTGVPGGKTTVRDEKGFCSP